MKTELWIRRLLRCRPRAKPVLQIGEVEHMKGVGRSHVLEHLEGMAQRHVIEPMAQGGQHPVIAGPIKTPEQPLRRQARTGIGKPVPVVATSDLPETAGKDRIARIE